MCLPQLASNGYGVKMQRKEMSLRKRKLVSISLISIRVQGGVSWKGKQAFAQTESPFVHYDNIQASEDEIP